MKLDIHKLDSYENTDEIKDRTEKKSKARVKKFKQKYEG